MICDYFNFVFDTLVYVKYFDLSFRDYRIFISIFYDKIFTTYLYNKKIKNNYYKKTKV